MVAGLLKKSPGKSRLNETSGKYLSVNRGRRYVLLYSWNAYTVGKYTCVRWSLYRLREDNLLDMIY